MSKVLTTRFAALLAAFLLALACAAPAAVAFADPEEGTGAGDTSATTDNPEAAGTGEGTGTGEGAGEGGSASGNPESAGLGDEGITILPSGATLDPEAENSAGTVLVEDPDATGESDPASVSAADSAASTLLAKTALASLEATLQRMAADDPTTSGEGSTPDPDDPAATGDGTAPNGSEQPGKPYSTLTPVGGEDNSANTVNTHQLPDSSFLYDTSIVDLATATSYFDGQTVQVTGEVIGDIIKSGESPSHVWVTLASTTPSDATIMVYMPVSTASIIDTLGEYGKTGTILQVRGTYHLVCPDHEGLSDLHAENVNVVAPGSTSPDEFAWTAFRPGLILIGIAVVLTLVLSFIRQRLR